MTPTSLLAGSIFSYSHALLFKDFFWTDDLVTASGGYKFSQLRQTIEDIQMFISEINPRFSKCIYDKYGRHWYPEGLVEKFKERIGMGLF
jgi:hypothetical protein